MRRLRKNLIYFFILLVPFYIFFVRTETAPSLKLAVVKVVSFPIKVISFPFKELKKILYYHRTFDEYMRLRKETQVLQGRMTTIDEVIQENNRLKQLLAFKRQLIYSSVVANVVGRDPSFWNSSMIIDRGEEDGIQPGMPVVNAFGVVGKITEVGKGQSKVILLTDPQFSVAALIQRARESVLVSGSLKGVCRLRFISETADIQVGDKVVTSKLSSTFPENLIVGEVVYVPPPTKANAETEYLVKPAVSFSQLEEVLVVIK